MTARQRRVVVTGLGIVSPVGIGVAAAWDSITNGRSGIGPITRFDSTPFNTHIAGEVKGFDPAQYMSGKEARRYDTFIHYGIAAARRRWPTQVSRPIRPIRIATACRLVPALAACR